MGAAVERVRVLRELRRLDDAEHEAGAALAGDPRDAGVLAELAAVLLEAGRHVDGLAAADAALAADPAREWTHRLRAALLSRLGRHGDAVSAALRAAELDPDGAHPAIDHSRVLRAAGRQAEARRAAERAVRLDPQLPGAHLELAMTRAQMGEPRPARESYQETLRLDPQNACARRNLAVLDANAGTPLRALRGLLEAGAMDPADTDTTTTETIRRTLHTVIERVHLWLVLAAGLTAGLSFDPAADNRLVAAVALLVVLVVICATARSLAPAGRRAVLALVRADTRTWLICLGIAASVLVQTAIAATGSHPLALGAAAWQVLSLTKVVAALATVRQRRRSARASADATASARRAEAEALLDAVEPTGPSTPGPAEVDAAVSYAQMLRRAGRGEDAEWMAGRLVELAPVSVEAHLALADIASWRSHAGVARRAYTEALRLEPGHTGARHGLVDLDRRANRLNSALRGLLESERSDPGSAVPLTTAVLARLNAWLLAVLLLPGPVGLLAGDADPDGLATVVPITAGVVLLVCAVMVARCLRGLGRAGAALAWAALRGERRLQTGCGATAVCLVAYLAAAITGYAEPVLYLFFPAVAVVAAVAGSRSGNAPGRQR